MGKGVILIRWRGERCAIDSKWKKGREDKEKQGVKRISEERLMGAFLGGDEKGLVLFL